MFLHFAEAYLRIDYLEFMNRIGIAAVAVLMVLTLLASCVNERYTLSEDRLNLEVTVFQDGVTLPLGSTSKIMLKDVKDSLLMNMEDQSLLQYVTVGEDGGYGISISDRLDVSDTLNELVSQIEIPDISISETFGFSLSAFDVSDLKSFAYEAYFEKMYEMTVLSSCDLLDQIVSVDRIELEDAYFTLSMEASRRLDLIPTDLVLDFEVVLPEMIVLDSCNVVEDNVLHIRAEIGRGGVVTIDPIRIAALDLSRMDMSNIESLKDTITVKGKVVMNLYDWIGRNLTVKLDAGVRDIRISKFLGKLDVHLPSIERTLDLTPYKESLQNDNFEVEGFEHLLSKLDLAAEIKTNIGIPMGARLVVTPYSGGEPDEQAAWSEDLDIRHSESATDTTYTSFGLSLNSIPDSLKLVMEIGSDPSKTSVIEPMQEYVAGIAYSLTAPFEFGDGTVVTYTDTIKDVPQEVGQFLAMGDLVLTGDLTSNLPLSIGVKVNLIDSDGCVIALDEAAGQQRIGGCSPDGEPTLTELYLGFRKKKGTESKEVSAVELEFDITPVAGMSLSDKCYVQAVLQALVPEGVSIDLNELMKEKDE